MMSLVEASLLPVWIIVACTLVTSLGANQKHPESPRAANHWRIWLIVAVLMAPTSILGWVKIGGDVNALAYTVYFLAVAAHLRLLHICSRRQTDFHPKLWKLAGFVPLLLPISLAVWVLPEVTSRLPSLVARFPENPERVAFEFAKQHPGEVYFPFNPLITLMSEGRAYHFSDGLWIRELANLQATPKHVRTFVPERMRMIAYTAFYDHSREYFPQFAKRTRINGLPGWNVLTVDGKTEIDDGQIQ